MGELKRGQKAFKPARHSELIRINDTLPPRLQYLKDIRLKENPKISVSDLINEAIEAMLDFEDVPLVIVRIDRKGVEL